MLESVSAPYYLKSYESFLQGSYGNDTNIYADSDVDIVMKLNSTYFHDTSALSPLQLTAFNTGFVLATYTIQDFKRDVLAWLSRPSNFGAVVTPGPKALNIASQGNRRSADVLICSQFRRYFAPAQWQGVCFFLGNGARVENFPKQHSQNCTGKHQQTNSAFKRTVRVFKNLRNRMIDDGVIRGGLAPSYFLEGMLYNVPDDKFGACLGNTFVNCFNWLVNASSTQFLCANGLQLLVADYSTSAWPTVNYTLFLNKLRDYWNHWP